VPIAANVPASRRYSTRRRVSGAGALVVALAAGVAVERGLCGTMTDIAYGDNARQRLDVYRPRSAAGAPAPVIVFFYGGRWQSGGKGWYRIVGRTLAALGYAVVIPDYRLYPDVKFPAFLEDGAKAVRWTRDNAASFGGDARRIFVMGHSAGAYIAAMLALDPQWLNGVGLDAGRDIAGLIGVAGPYDFLPLRDPKLVDMFGGAGRQATQPISFANGRKPPALLLTGDADTIVDPGNSARLAEALRRNGNDASEVIYPRFGHITIMAAFLPLLGRFFPALADVQAFVGRVDPAVPRHVSSLARAVSP
jgi:acetyl esterase/lipase